ncbi:bifunctional [glutamine synthetase] adenylyltransferase/[glutamine synthetase]-adenylyl-L-tyrosine phosphorylase [Gardnerella vaginalis]|uniref:bifunctional [glutamine synthetase] adenylyltransferase/[glutamine synthetase]-adenylyl-L-tyrosine phosphorylase n=1 Tax=Gardnerella vaginalis TaxID=2702 RepID=UPI0020103722|nr:bifunctional [glutamine synthetase] adenylyltransferase/[glutamine synthetase]-adenylyl-L-tyrosine phosphorylase [Gardnerella vaginalis]UQA79719.1 bifunctional [glutamine synthetase] adenylyltransferase/[glutamine synthetase]-adenylyl-L-tyrosine phosphorylase [Gardnerella vaginalis]
MYSGVMSKESSNAGDLSNGFSAILNVGLKDDLQNRSKNSLNFAQENDLSYRSLVKAGFARPESARKVIEDVCKNCANNSINAVKILESISRVEDPDYAILAFNDIYQSHKKVVENIAQNSNNSLITSPLSSLMQVLGASKAFAMLMRTREDLISAAASDPNHLLHMTLEERVSDLLEAVQSYSATVVNEEKDYNKNCDSCTVPISSMPFAQAVCALRARYRQHIAAIMAYDLASADPVELQPDISCKLSDAADAALEAALAIARGQVSGSCCCKFAIIAMGKLGAREINYVSDIDLIYVVEPTNGVKQDEALRVGSSIALVLQKVCQSVVIGCAEPPLWQIDTALRPEGKDGPLVRRLESNREYYEKWASSWEFQALLKSRPAAGDMQLGKDYRQMADSLIWKASGREHFVADCQHMRQRVESLIPASHRDLDMKLGRGGLRDVEFTVQMLQLVHGSEDTSLRVRDTLGALNALSAGGYVSRSQAAILAEHYRFERVLEHRQQMWNMQRTHLFPDLGAQGNGGLDRARSISVEELNSNEQIRRLARAVRLKPEELVARFDKARREIRHLHKDIYYRPMLPINAQTDADPIVLSAEAARARFASIGFADAKAAQMHVEALTEGLSRAAKIHRILLPAVLKWLGEGQNPDMGLLAFRRLSERFGGKNTYLGFLRDSPSAAQRLCHVLSDSRYLGDAMMKSIQSITWLGDDSTLAPRGRESLDMQTRAMVARYSSSIADFAQSLRALRRQEIERVALAWMCGIIDDDTSMQAMSDVFDAVLDSALQWAMKDASRKMCLDKSKASIAIIALGRYGGREVNFCSDADMMVVYKPTQDICGCDSGDDSGANLAHRFAQTTVDILRNILQGPLTLEPKIMVDLDLRPEGKDGPLVRSLESCERYYQKWASTWENQALLRARFAAGSKELADALLSGVVNDLRYSLEPLSESQLAEIRKLKARMEAERLPRGVSRDRHLKLGRGGLSDVEWTVQLLQLQYAGKYESLRTVGTMQALKALKELHLIEDEDANVLERCWHMCSAVRNANFLWSGSLERADVIPTDSYSLGGIATYLGYDPNQGRVFENDLMAVMRQCREVMSRLFYCR